MKTLQETNSKWQDEKDINYDVWGNFYVSIGQKDSAAYYFKKNIGHNNVYSDIGAYRNLYEIEKKRGNYEEGLSISGEIYRMF